MNNTPSLLACPFCGSAAHFESDSDGWHWVECESCGMQGNRGASLMEDCKPMLAEAWNRRTPQPAPAPLSEMPYEKRKAIQEGEQIGASDAWFHARLNMLDTLDRRNVFRAGFDRGWNAALAAQERQP